MGSMVLAVLPLQSFSSLILASIGREGDSIFCDALLISFLLPTLDVFTKCFSPFDRPLSADQIRVNHQSQDRKGLLI
jgi:hypothetical protein